MKKILLYLTIGFCVGIITCFAGYFIYTHSRTETARPGAYTERVDTCITKINRRVIRPSFASQTKIPEYVFVTVPVEDVSYVNYADSFAVQKSINDSLTVALQRIQRKFSDDSTYVAWVSGVEPKLDSINFIIPQTTIYKTVTKEYRPKLSFGIQAGAGMVFPGFKNPVPGGYIGIGVEYNF